MNIIVFLLQILTITLPIHFINGMIVTGPETNVSNVSWKPLMKNKQLKALLPEIRLDEFERLPEDDATVARRFYMKIFSSIRKQLDKEHEKLRNADSGEFESKDFIDYDEDQAFMKRVSTPIKYFLDRDLIGLNEFGVNILKTDNDIEETLKALGLNDFGVNIVGKGIETKEDLETNIVEKDSYYLKNPNLLATL